MRAMKPTAGFTLVEIVLTILILGILGGVLGPFIAKSAEAYRDTRGRSELTARARIALERLAREVRRAVPNTVTTVSGGAGVEFVTSKLGGRYMSRGDAYASARYPMADRFQKHASLTGLYILGTAYSNFADTDFLVVHNDGTVGLASAAVGLNAIANQDRDGDGTAEVQLLTFDAAHQWTTAADSQHFQIADFTHEVGVVGGNALRWRRTAGITGMDGAAAYGGGDPILVAADAVAATFAYAPTSLTNNAILRVTLTLTEGSDNVVVSQEMHVRNVP